MIEAEVRARRRILAEWCGRIEQGRRVPSWEEAVIICAQEGCRFPPGSASAFMREAAEVYVGAAYGVGPRATRRDKLVAWWRKHVSSPLGRIAVAMRRWWR